MTFIISHFLQDRIQVHLSGVLWLGLSQDCNQGVAQGFRHLKAQLGERIPSRLTRGCWQTSASHWLLTGVISSLPMRWISPQEGHNMVAGFQQRNQVRTGERRHSLISKVTSHYFDHLPLVRIKSLGSSHAQGKGMTQGCEFQRSSQRLLYHPSWIAQTTTSQFPSLQNEDK